MTNSLAECVKVNLNDLQRRSDSNPTVNLLKSLETESKVIRKRSVNPFFVNGSKPKILNVGKPIFYSRRQFVDKINNFLSFLEIDTVLFPKSTPDTIKQGALNNIRKARDSLTELRARLLYLSNFVDITALDIQDAQRTHLNNEKVKRLKTKVPLTKCNVTVTPVTNIKFGKMTIDQSPKLESIKIQDTFSLAQPTNQSWNSMQTTSNNYITHSVENMLTNQSIVNVQQNDSANLLAQLLSGHTVTNTQANLLRSPIVSSTQNTYNTSPLISKNTQNYISPLNNRNIQTSLSDDYVDVETVDKEPIDFSKYYRMDF